MSALLRARLLANVASVSTRAFQTRSVAGLSRPSVLSLSSTRSFMSSSPQLAAAAASAATKTKKTPAAKKAASKETTTAKKPAKKTATKKAAVPKKKKKAVKVVQKPIKPTAEMLPPKPPAGSSGLFHQETPRHLHESTREAGTAEFKRVAEAWNALSEPEKMEYTAKATEKRAQYLKDWEKWYLNTHPAVFKLINSTRKAKGRKTLTIPPELQHLKRPSNSYTTFFKERYDPSKSTPENGKEIGAAWKALSESEKERYVVLAKANGEKWEREVRAHRYGLENPLATKKVEIEVEA